MEYRRLAAATILAALALLSTAAPATARPGLFGSAAERTLPIDVTVEEVPAEDVWNVAYVLPREVAGVEFVHGRNAFRAERWGVGVHEGEAVWHADRQRRGRERICFTVPARAFSVGFRTWTDRLPQPSGPGARQGTEDGEAPAQQGARPSHGGDHAAGSATRLDRMHRWPNAGGLPDRRAQDHELNAAFGDGSRLLYTGHLRVRPLTSCGAIEASPLPGLPEHRFTFTTTEGRGVRVGGDAGSGSLRWTPPAGPDGEPVDTYVYFGDLPPAAGSTGDRVATVLLDPDLPAWMRDEVEASVPRLVERFTDLTGTPLPLRPLVVVSWGGDRQVGGGSGASFSGDTLPGVLLASAQGPGWLEADEAARREWFHHLARETFRLWSGGSFRPDDGSEWLSEAAADHFAFDAAVALGRVAEAEAERWLIERANDCLVRLAGRSLREAAGGSDDDALRSCGAVALATAHGALRRAEPPSDLASLFRRLFEHAAATGSYGTAPFLGGLRELRADPDAVTEIRRLILTGQSTRAEVLLRRLLGHAGVRTVPVPLGEAAADPATLAEIVRRAVGRCWCGSESDGECDPIETGEGVTAVDGTQLGADPGAAWERVAAAARGAELPVTLDGLDTTLFCGPELFDPTWTALLAPAPASEG